LARSVDFDDAAIGLRGFVVPAPSDFLNNERIVALRLTAKLPE
jgi:hypothetical protein